MRFTLNAAIVVAQLLLGFTDVAQAQHYEIFNKCPIDIDVYVGSPNREIEIRKGQSFVVTGPWVKTPRWPNEHIYSPSNGGLDSSGKFIGTRTFFDLRPGYRWYYVQRHPNPNNINLGMSIVPNYNAPHHGFCTPAVCNAGNCTAEVYREMENKYPPGENSPAPAPPTHRCPEEGDIIGLRPNFNITFCPTGKLPGPPIGTPIRSSLNTQKCLDVRGAVFKNGTAVQIYDCNGTKAQQWVVKQGTGQVRVAGTNFCLDSTVAEPKDGQKLKIWQCIDGVKAQRWILSNTDTFYDSLRLESKTSQCLDLTDLNVQNGNVVQTWGCAKTPPTETRGPKIWLAHTEVYAFP